MSLAHHVRERGTWSVVAIVAIALAVSTGNLGGAFESPAVQAAAAVEAPPKKRTGSADTGSGKSRKKPKRKRRPATVEDMIRREFGSRANEALKVARCESKLDPKARSRAGAAGVFQLMPVHTWRVKRVKGKHLYDARTNIKVARHLYRDEGWRPWVCARILGMTG